MVYHFNSHEGRARSHRAAPSRTVAVPVAMADVHHVRGVPAAAGLAAGAGGAISRRWPAGAHAVGGGILRRLVVTFDYRDRRMYLEPAAGVPRHLRPRRDVLLARR